MKKKKPLVLDHDNRLIPFNLKPGQVRIGIGYGRLEHKKLEVGVLDSYYETRNKNILKKFKSITRKVQKLFKYIFNYTIAFIKFILFMAKPKN